MQIKENQKFEGILERHTLFVVRKFLFFLLILSFLSLLLSFFDYGIHYYFLSCQLFLLSVIIFFITRKRGKVLGLLVENFYIIVISLLVFLLIFNDFIFFIKPILYIYTLLFLVEGIKEVLFFQEYNSLLLKRKEMYKIVASYENCNILLGKVSRYLLHDMATPVSVLSCSYELLERKYLSKGERVIFKSNLKYAIEQIDAILHSTDFLMKKSQQRCYFSVNECVRQVINLLENRIRRDEIVVKERFDTNGKIFGDRNVFLRIFLNVFLNSIEELERRGKDYKEIFVEIFETPKYLCVSVVDNGDGLDPKLQVMLNNANYMFSGKHMGLGSGLIFIKYCMKEVFNGRIRIKYDEEEGMNYFRLYFPKSF